MDIKSLMIGDWVYNKHHGKNIRLTPYDFFTHTHNEFGGQRLVPYATPTIGLDLEPIPLTPEILEKNGFEKWDDGWCTYDQENTGIEVAWVGTILKIGGQCGNLELPDVMYVHQLQHALKLCGISKEIEL